MNCHGMNCRGMNCPWDELPGMNCQGMNCHGINCHLPVYMHTMYYLRVSFVANINFSQCLIVIVNKLLQIIFSPFLRPLYFLSDFNLNHPKQSSRNINFCSSIRKNLLHIRDVPTRFSKVRGETSKITRYLACETRENFHKFWHHVFSTLVFTTFRHWRHFDTELVFKKSFISLRANV